MSISPIAVYEKHFHQLETPTLHKKACHWAQVSEAAWVSKSKSKWANFDWLAKEKIELRMQ